MTAKAPGLHRWQSLTEMALYTVKDERERDSVKGVPLGVFGYDLFERELFRRPPFLGRGTFAPFFRASDNPMAIACSRLFTLPP